MTGQSGTFGQGLNFGYPYQQGPDSYVDELDAAGGTVVLRSQDNVGRAVCFAGSDYRTVLSATIFSALGGTDRRALMESCMNYLLYGTGVGEHGRPAAPASVSVVPSVVRAGRAIQLRSSGPARQLAVLDVSGRTMATWRLGAGEATVTWDAGPAAPGAYFLQARSSGRTETRSFAVVR